MLLRTLSLNIPERDESESSSAVLLFYVSQIAKTLGPFTIRAISIDRYASRPSSTRHPQGKSSSPHNVPSTRDTEDASCAELSLKLASILGWGAYCFPVVSNDGRVEHASDAGEGDLRLLVGLRDRARGSTPIRKSFFCAPTPQARYPGQLFTADGGCSACNPETKELGAFAAELLAVVAVDKSRGKALGRRYSPRGEVTEMEPPERLSWLEMMRSPVRRLKRER